MFNINLKGIFGMGSAILLLSMLVSSCDFGFDLPEENSIPDETPPTANFSMSPDEGSHLTIEFTNLSLSATDFLWDFGDGNTSTEKDPSNTYPENGTYTITLTATDKLNQTSTFTEEIEIVEPIIAFIPEILNPGFDVQGDDEFRDGWRNSGLGGVIQITSGPIHFGEKAAKLPAEGDRIGYQLITVLPATDYVLTFFYTLKTDNPGSVIVTVLDGAVNDPAAIDGATIGSFVGTDQTSASDFTQGSILFNSAANTEVAIYFTNEGEEGRIDSFEIAPL